MHTFEVHPFTCHKKSRVFFCLLSLGGLTYMKLDSLILRILMEMD